jgi:selenocysteine lyase/cysteine desulfurase
MTDRREFLKIAGAATLGASWSAPAAASAGVTAATAREAFAFPEDRVPMNAANLCPMPVAVRDAIGARDQALDHDMSHVSRGRVEQQKEQARSRLAAQLGVSPDTLAIVRNTSEANNVVVQGMPLEAGDEVLLWDQNHPSNGVAWDVQASRQGFVVKRLSLPASVRSVEEVVSLFTTEVSARTRVVSFTHISNVSGTRLPAADVCRALHAKYPEVHVHVDGAQTWGVIDVDLAALDCDSFSASAHKWYMGPREVGLLYVREPHIAKLWPNCVSVPWGSSPAPEVRGARRFEAFGQRDDAAIAALSDTVAFHERLTPAAIERRATVLAERLRDGLQNLGVRFVSPLHVAFSSNVVILSAPPANGNVLVQRVLDDAGIIVAAVGGLRMTPHVYNTDAHIDRMVDAVAGLRDLLAG